MREWDAFLGKTYFRHDSIWSDGYFVSTAGIDETIIKKYIEQQGQKDLGRLKVVWWPIPQVWARCVIIF